MTVYFTFKSNTSKGKKQLEKSRKETVLFTVVENNLNLGGFLHQNTPIYIQVICLHFCFRNKSSAIKKVGTVKNAFIFFFVCEKQGKTFDVNCEKNKRGFSTESNVKTLESSELFHQKDPKFFKSKIAFLKNTKNVTLLKKTFKKKGSKA